MNQGAALKRKVLNSNKRLSPVKNASFDYQFRSSAELVKQFQIKKEKLDNEHKNKVVKDQAPPYKRKTSMPITSNVREKSSMQRSIQFEESIQLHERNQLSVHKSVIQPSSRKEVNTSHMVGRTQGEEEKQLDIEEMQNYKKVKRKSLVPAMCLNHFLKKNGIHVGEEKQPCTQQADDVRSMPSPCINENDIEVDDVVAQEEVDECVRDKDMNINCSKGTLKKKKVRGQTTCKDIHARSFEEREEVTFDHGQAVGPTGKRVSDLSNFLGTIARNSRFITLLYTGWPAVPDDTKLRMWQYVNTKFIIPAEGQKWVMDGLRDAWRRHKNYVKENYFDKYNTMEDRLKNCPSWILEVQFH